MTLNHAFEFRRAVDGVVYRFDREARESGPTSYVRSDGAVRVAFAKGVGWVARDSKTGEINGIPWCVPIDQQNSAYPPEGSWVSKKAEKSHVYELAYIVASE